MRWQEERRNRLGKEAIQQLTIYFDTIHQADFLGFRKPLLDY